jgi:WD40 repeat protein
VATARGETGKTFIDEEITTKVKNKDGEEEKPTGAAHRGLVESVAISPDNKWVISGGFQEIAVWDRDSGQIIRKVDGLADRVTCLAVSPDGKFLAAGGGAPTLEGEIKIYELPQLKRVADLPTAHSDTVYGLAFSADGKLLASAGADKFVRVWEVPSGKAIKSMEGHTHHAMDVSWKADGKLLASAGADSTIRVWTYETGEQARSITGHTNQVNRVMFVGATPQVATVAGDMTARVWNAENSQAVRTFAGAKGFLQSLAVSKDGKTIAAGGQDGKVLVFELATGKLLKTLPDDKFVEKPMPMPKPMDKPSPKPPEKGPAKPAKN